MWSLVTLVLSSTLGVAAPRLEDALAAEAAGDDQRAIAMLESTIAQQPAWEQPRLEAGRIRLKVGADLDRAEFDLEVARALAPENPRAQYLWGLVREERGANDEALRAYRLALEFRPSYDEARFRLAGLYFAREDWEHAELEYRELARRDPHSVQARLQLVSALERQGKDDAAQAELLSLWSEERSKAAGRRLAELYERTGQTQKAKRLRAELESGEPRKKMRPLQKSRR